MEVYGEVTIFNYNDEIMVHLGVKQPAEIRSVTIKALVDSGTTSLVLPQEIADQLGLLPLGRVPVTYVSGHREYRTMAGAARVEMFGRSDITSVLVEKPGSTALLGHVTLELLDLVMEPNLGQVRPRDPALWLRRE